MFDRKQDKSSLCVVCLCVYRKLEGDLIIVGLYILTLLLNLLQIVSFCSVIQGHDQSSTLSQHTVELTLPKHSPLHRDLLRYAKLMEWLKNTHREKYEGLSRVSAISQKILKGTVRCFVQHAYLLSCRQLDEIDTTLISVP